MTSVCLHDPSSVRNPRDCVHCLRRDLATRDRELAEARAALEQESTRLAGCGAAAIGYIDGACLASPGDYGWSASYGDVLKLRREYAEARADIVAAAGELLVPVPEPGTDMGRVMLANVAMRRERDQTRAALAEKEREAAELRAERDQLKRQWAEWVNKAFAGKEALTAAQEEAKGLRAALAAIARNDEDFDAGCRHLIVARNALAARQQQPRGKKEDGNADD